MSNILSSFSYYYNHYYKFFFIYYFIHKYLFEISFLEGDSMLPTFNKHSTLVFIDKFSPIFFRPKIDQIVIVNKNGIEMCKRIKKIKTIEKNIFIWIEGDNKKNSFDSRNFGWIKKDFIIGNVLIEIYPKMKILNKNQIKI